MQVFTIVARNYLALALTLADSVAQIHPEAKMTIVIADDLDGLEPADRRYVLVPAREFLGSEFDDLAFRYDVTEFCTAVKPFVFGRLLAVDGEPVFYLDPDMRLYGRLDPVLDFLGHREIVLTPHLLELQQIEDRAYPEFLHLWTGIFNLGFCALKGGARSRDFVGWWTERLRRYCYADRHDGLHTDQKWVDYAPVFFGDALGILRHRGVNVAYWNIDERPLVRDADGDIRAGPDPLLLFHFSGFRFATLELTKQPAADAKIRYDDTILRDLSAEYRDAVFANGYERLIQLPYRLQNYSDGVPVTGVHRRLYRQLSREESFPEPFVAIGEFRVRLQQAGLVDKGAAAAANYSARSFDGLGRAIEAAERALGLLSRVLGPRRYAYMIRFFGLYGRIEAHVFLTRR
jgi:hypothetical protein